MRNKELYLLYISSSILITIQIRGGLFLFTSSIPVSPSLLHSFLGSAPTIIVIAIRRRFDRPSFIQPDDCLLALFPSPAPVCFRSGQAQAEYRCCKRKKQQRNNGISKAIFSSLFIFLFYVSLSRSRFIDLIDMQSSSHSHDTSQPQTKKKCKPGLVQ